MCDESYNGWANRETWAFVLHCDNTIGSDYVAELVSGRVLSGDSDYDLGDHLVDAVRDMWADDPSAEWVGLMRDDVGSVWRVDLREVGKYAWGQFWSVCDDVIR